MSSILLIVPVHAAAGAQLYVPIPITRKLGNGKENATLLREITLRAGVSSARRSFVVLSPPHRDAVPRRWIVLGFQDVSLQRAWREYEAICENVLALKWRRGAVVSEFSSEIADSSQASWLARWLAAQQFLVIADDVAR